MKGQLNLFEPEFIKDIDCTIDTPVTRGKKDKAHIWNRKAYKTQSAGKNRNTAHERYIP